MTFAPLLLLALAVQADPAADEALKRAIQLPVVAHELRQDGVPEQDVDVALEAGRTAGMGAGGTTEVLEATRDAGRKDGHPENFGAFVQARIQEGLRGQDLSAAIRAEHAARKAEREAAKAAEGAPGASGEAPGQARADEAKGKADESHGKAGGSKGGGSSDEKKTGGKGGK